MSARTEAAIRAFLRTELGLRDDTIAADTPLITSGLVDSTGVVRLAALLEKEVDCLIPDQDLTNAHFDSIAKILAYLAAKSR